MKNNIQVVVVAIIKNKGKYLLTKRYEPTVPLTHETWQLPGGGLEFNETVTACLIREVREELNVEVDIVSKPIIRDNIIDEWGWHGVTIAYVCKLKNEDAKIALNHEATEYKWLSYKEAASSKLHFGTSELLQEAEKI